MYHRANLIYIIRSSKPIKDFGWVSGRPDSHVLRAEIPEIPAMRARVRAPESQKVRGILGGIPGESGI
jgi:hypothetical protein